MFVLLRCDEPHDVITDFLLLRLNICCVDWQTYMLLFVLVYSTVLCAATNCSAVAAQRYILLFPFLFFLFFVFTLYRFVALVGIRD